MKTYFSVPFRCLGSQWNFSHDCVCEHLKYIAQSKLYPSFVSFLVMLGVTKPLIVKLITCLNIEHICGLTISFALVPRQDAVIR